LIKLRYFTLDSHFKLCYTLFLKMTPGLGVGIFSDPDSLDVLWATPQENPELSVYS